MKPFYYLKVTDEVEYADSKMFRVRINPEYENHAGLIAHEETHVKQWYMVFIPLMVLAICCWFIYREDVAVVLGVLAFTLKELMYTFVPKARLYLEIEAYKAQMDAVDSINYDYYAELICNHYNLNVDKEEVIERLKY